jgi:TrmH family RNA methyltransferase
VLTNPRADRVRSVRALARRAARVRTGRFVVDGPQGVREAVRYAAERIVDVYLTPEAAQRHRDVVDPARAAGLWVHEVSDDVMAAMAGTDTPQGLLAVVRDEPVTLEEVLARNPRVLVVLAHVRDPGNAGTVIRGADALGADAVLVSEASVEVLAPKVVRSTAGSLFHVPVVTGLELPATFAALRDRGVRLLAADGTGSAALPHVDLVAPHAWVLGNEAWGTSEELRAACDEVVRVPTPGHAESLNLAMAATLCLYASSVARSEPPAG